MGPPVPRLWEARSWKTLQASALVVGCKEYDLVTIPADIPALGVKMGEAELVRELDLRIEGDVVATLELVAPTGLTKGWVEMEVHPAEKVLSYAQAG